MAGEVPGGIRNKPYILESIWKCPDVGNLPDGYTKSSPLPRVNPNVSHRLRLPLAKLGRALAFIAPAWISTH